MKKNNKKRIVFWGAPPPPIGGMTVHIFRLSNHLRSSGWDCKYYDFKNPMKIHDKNRIPVNNLVFWYLSLWFSTSPKIHYIITTRPLIRFLSSLLVIRGKKVVIREGGGSLERESKAGISGWIMNAIALRLCSAFIGVNSDICKFSSKFTSKDKINHIPGFIPPHDDGSNKAPNEIVDFFRDSPHKIVVSGQVSSNDEGDIYGLWHLVESFKLLKKELEEKRIKLCIVSYSFLGENKDKRQLLRNFIEENKLQSNVMLYHNDGDLWPILKTSNLFLRTSYTDGDSNALREAYYFNNHIIASDCVPRPPFCKLYKTKDDLDLKNKILEHIKEMESSINTEKVNKQENNAIKIESMLINLIK